VSSWDSMSESILRIIRGSAGVKTSGAIGFFSRISYRVVSIPCLDCDQVRKP
jgi:hypothetical protein